MPTLVIVLSHRTVTTSPANGSICVQGGLEYVEARNSVSGNSSACGRITTTESRYATTAICPRIFIPPKAPPVSFWNFSHSIYDSRPERRRDHSVCKDDVAHQQEARGQLIDLYPISFPLHHPSIDPSLLFTQHTETYKRPMKVVPHLVDE